MFQICQALVFLHLDKLSRYLQIIKKIKYLGFFETVFVRSSTLCVLRQIFSQLLQDLGNKENLSKSLSKADPKKFKIYYCLEFIRMHNKESGQI